MVLEPPIPLAVPRFYLFIFVLYVTAMCVSKGVRVSCVHVEVRGQLWEAGSLHLRVFYKPDSRAQACTPSTVTHRPPHELVLLIQS